MEDNNHHSPSSQQPSEGHGNVRQSAADFGNIPQPTASFGNMRQSTEKSENHTVTVREAARLFEAAGVARIERSIVNWCHPNRQGVARLDCYFDENERKYYITPQSIDRAIVEEKAKAERHGEPLPQAAEAPRESSNTAEEVNRAETVEPGEAAADHLRQLVKEVMDLKILNSGKDFFIDQLRQERDGFVQQLVKGSRRIGELETELRRITTPRQNVDSRLPNGPEGADGRGA
jgi:hypothetical protein